MIKARIYARNLIANWVGHGANMVVLFFLSPFVVNTLGKVEYGIWSLLMVLTGYMGMLDLGIRASTGRHIILYLGKEDYKGVDETIRTGLGFFSVIGLLILAVGLCMGRIFPSAFSSVPPEYHGLVGVLLPLLAANVWLTAFRAVFSSVLTAHDRFDLARGVDLVMLAVRTVGTILALSWGYGILGLTLVVIACNIVGLAGNWLLARRIYPRLKSWPVMLSRTRLRELFGYGVAAFLSAIAVKIIGQTDLIIVGAAISVSAVAVYSVGAMLIYYSVTFISLIGGTFFPPVQRAVARGEMGSAKWLFFRQVRLAFIFGVPAFVGFIVFGESFIRLWMLGPKFGEQAVVQAALIMAILAGSKLLFLFTVGSHGLLAAMGHIRFSAAVTLTEALLNLGLSVFFVLILRWGLAGVAAGTLAARLVVGTFTTPWYACRKMGIGWGSFVLRIGGTGVASMCLFAAWCMVVRGLFPVDSWPEFIGQVFLALVGYVPIALWILLPKNDRKRIWKRLGLHPS